VVEVVTGACRRPVLARSVDHHKVGMIATDGWIWTEFNERFVEPGVDWVIDMLLVVDGGDGAAACAVLEDAIGGLQQRFADDPSPDVAGREFGAWVPIEIPEGVQLYVSRSDVFERVLPALLEVLDAAGFDGTLSLRDGPRSRPVACAPLLSCRVSLRGDRLTTGPGAYGWVADPTACRAFLTSAIRWCRRDGGSVAHLEACLGDFANGESVLRDAFEWSELELHANDVRRIYSVDSDGFRGVAWARCADRVALIDGRVRDDGVWWRSALESVLALLRRHAEELEYAAVWRGWDVSGAMSPAFAPRDWPRRPNSRPAGVWQTETAFDSLVAGDAYGVQLFGPGFLDRLPGLAAAWAREELPGRRLLVRHQDLDSWFDAPMVAPHERPEPLGAPTPDVLRVARTALAPILHAPGALARLGFDDLDQ
jgi:hypothetical protein